MPHATDSTEVPNAVSEDIAGSVSRVLAEIRPHVVDDSDPRGWVPVGYGEPVLISASDRLRRIFRDATDAATDEQSRRAYQRLEIEVGQIAGMRRPLLCWPILRRLLVVAGLAERADEIARPGGMGGGK